eukprot:1780717-Alexandrium_andersonii.AAC.1
MGAWQMAARLCAAVGPITSGCSMPACPGVHCSPPSCTLCGRTEFRSWRLRPAHAWAAPAPS